MPTTNYDSKPTFVLLGFTVLWELHALHFVLRYSTLGLLLRLFIWFYSSISRFSRRRCYAFRLDLVLLFCYNRDNAGAAQLFVAPWVGRFFSFSRLPRSKGLCDKVLRMVTYGGVVSFFTTFSPHCATWSNTSCVVRRDF